MAAKKKKTTGKKKPPKKDDDEVVIHPYKSNLTVALSREEVEDRAQRMSMLLADHDVKEQEIKERAKRDKSSLKGMETEIRRFGNAIRDKCEQRPVSCERRMNYTTGRVTDVRLDTGEVIDERDMTDIEKQREFKFEPGDVDDEFGDGEDDESDDSSDDSDEDEAAE